MKNKDVRKRRLNASYKSLILKCLKKLAVHFSVEVIEQDAEIFIEKLAPWTDYQITTAFDRCLTECLFFPHLKEVFDRMPEDRALAGPVRTCPLCEPDGRRVIMLNDARVVISCAHNENTPPSAPNTLDLVRPFAREFCRTSLNRDLDDLDPIDESKLIFACWHGGTILRFQRMGIDTTKWQTPPKPTGPRWPHLVGKGIAPQT